MTEQTDLEWVLSLGVSVEQLAARSGRTTTAIHAELEETARRRKGGGE